VLVLSPFPARNVPFSADGGLSKGDADVPLSAEKEVTSVLFSPRKGVTGVPFSPRKGVAGVPFCRGKGDIDVAFFWAPVASVEPLRLERSTASICSGGHCRCQTTLLPLPCPSRTDQTMPIISKPLRARRTERLGSPVALASPSKPGQDRQSWGVAHERRAMNTESSAPCSIERNPLSRMRQRNSPWVAGGLTGGAGSWHVLRRCCASRSASGVPAPGAFPLLAITGLLSRRG